MLALLFVAVFAQGSTAGFVNWGSYGSYSGWNTYWPYWSEADFSWLVVDDFSAPQPVLYVGSWYGLQTQSSFVEGSGILGNERDVSLISTIVGFNNAEPRSAYLNTGNVFHSDAGLLDTECLAYHNGASYGRDSSYPATVVVQWDGVDQQTSLDTTGLARVDLTEGGAHAFVVSGQAPGASHVVNGEIRVYSYNSTTHDFCTCPMALLSNPAATFSLFSFCTAVNNGCNMQSVGALELWLEDTFASFYLCHFGTYAGTEASALPSPTPTPSRSRSPSHSRSITSSRTRTRSVTKSRTTSPVPYLFPGMIISAHVDSSNDFDFRTSFISSSDHSTMTFSLTPSAPGTHCMYIRYETAPTESSYDYMACGGSQTVQPIVYGGNELLSGWYYGLITSNESYNCVVGLTLN